eukprot:10252971-Lingulodinium_polyedra.AAC.1
MGKSRPLSAINLSLRKMVWAPDLETASVSSAEAFLSVGFFITTALGDILRARGGQNNGAASALSTKGYGAALQSEC